jgi:hypothetical protein
MMQARAFLLATVIAFPAWAGGDASDGHTHGAPAAAPVPVTAGAPRAVAATEDFEVVGVLEGKHLVVYADRFASNEPVAKAKVEIEGAGLNGLARETAPGTYVMDLAAGLPPAKHALTIGIEAGDTADLLSATLDTTLTAASSEHVHGRAEWVVWIVAALLLTASALLVYRRRKARGI